jgi:hypothetical protein
MSASIESFVHLDASLQPGFPFWLSRKFGMFQFVTIYNLPQGLRLVNKNTQACFDRKVQIDLSASSYDFVFMCNLMNYFEITVFYQ